MKSREKAPSFRLRSWKQETGLEMGLYGREGYFELFGGDRVSTGRRHQDAGKG